MQTFIMGIIAAACVVSAVLWAFDGQWPAAGAFAGFGAGYAALAVMFA